MKQSQFNEEVNLFKEEVINLTTKIFESNKEITPILFNFLYKEDSEKQPIGVIGGFHHLIIDEKSKKEVALSLRKMVEKIKPIAVAFISEGYALKGKEEDFKDIEKYLETKSISEHPNRKEVIVINIETHDQECIVTFNINRDKKEPVLELSDSVDWQSKGENTDGLLQNFLTECYIEIEDDEKPDLSSF